MLDPGGYTKFVAELRSETDIVSVVGQYTDLRPAGSAFSGRCPLHDGPPAFHVDPDKKLFYCFNCKVGGDVFKFISAVNGISIQQAVEYVAALLPGAKTN